MSKAPNADAPALEWALFYASLGWAVFPIQPHTKNSFYRYPEFKNPERQKTTASGNQPPPEGVPIFLTIHYDISILILRTFFRDVPVQLSCRDLSGSLISGLYVFSASISGLPAK